MPVPKFSYYIIRKMPGLETVLFLTDEGYWVDNPDDAWEMDASDALFQSAMYYQVCYMVIAQHVRGKGPFTFEYLPTLARETVVAHMEGKSLRKPIPESSRGC